MTDTRQYVGEHALRVVGGFLGGEVAAIRRVMFESDGRRTDEGGSFELVFRREDPLLLEIGSDGETLVAMRRKWQDPFGAPATWTDETREFVARHGKWTIEDVSRMSPYSALLGAKLVTAFAIRTRYAKVCGVRLVFEHISLDVGGTCDELLVSFEPTSSWVVEHQVTIAESLAGASS